MRTLVRFGCAVAVAVGIVVASGAVPKAGYSVYYHYTLSDYFVECDGVTSPGTPLSEYYLDLTCPGYGFFPHVDYGGLVGEYEFDF